MDVEHRRHRHRRRRDESVPGWAPWPEPRSPRGVQHQLAMTEIDPFGPPVVPVV